MIVSGTWFGKTIQFEDDRDFKETITSMVNSYEKKKRQAKSKDEASEKAI